jgi:hypothetical protein
MTRLGVWKTGTCIAYENRVTAVPAFPADKYIDGKQLLELH